MSERHYIQVVVPVKLEWFPWYWSETALEQGTRVRVRLGRNVYTGFVLNDGGQPDIDPKRIQPVISVESQLERISDEEIKLWRFIADYYLCTIGEVFKAAYPALVTEVEGKKARTKIGAIAEAENGADGGLALKKNDEEKTGQQKRQKSLKQGCVGFPEEFAGARKKLDDDGKRAVTEILDAFDDRKTVLLQGVARQAIYDELTRRTLEAGRDVLVLSPGAKRMSSTERRDIARLLRSEKPVAVRSSRTAVFLPFHKLGLVIIDEEQDITYKQESPAPRYNARDVALMLAQLQGANVVLGSAAPSLESFYNVSIGKYQYVRLLAGRPHFSSATGQQPERTGDQGMALPSDIADNTGTGCPSGKSGALQQTGRTGKPGAELPTDGNGNVGPKAETSTEKDFLLIDTDIEKRKNGMVGELSRVLIAEKEALEAARKKVLVVNSWELGNISKLKLDKYALVAVLHFEFLFSRPDFRADEKAWQTLEKLKSAVKGRLVIQTANASHPVFFGNVERMMEERKAVNLPPFTRQVIAKGRNGEILMQACLPKDSSLPQMKRRFLEEASSMPGFVCVDVDPA